MSSTKCKQQQTQCGCKQAQVCQLEMGQFESFEIDTMIDGLPCDLYSRLLSRGQKFTINAH